MPNRTVFLCEDGEYAGSVLVFTGEIRPNLQTALDPLGFVAVDDDDAGFKSTIARMLDGFTSDHDEKPARKGKKPQQTDELRSSAQFGLRDTEEIPHG